MADYIFTVISNEFSTKNNEEVAKVFQDLGFEESYAKDDYVFVGSYGEQSWSDDFYVVKEKATGKVIGAYDGMYPELQGLEDLVADKLSIDVNDVDTKDYEEILLRDYVQDMLLDNEAFVLQETGHEKLRYNSGWAIVITRSDIKSFDLCSMIDEYLRGIK